jgi:HD superfamily phosphohydrolase
VRPKIPEPVRRNVINGWLHGISRDEIAKNNDIGAGTVSAIIKEAMQNDPEFDLQRQVALSLKKENNLDIKSFAPVIRIRNKLIKEMGLNNDEKSKVEEVQEIEHKIELLIVNLGVFCFKRGFSIDEFIDVIENMWSLKDKTKIPIEQLPNQLLQKQRHLESIEKEIQEIKFKKRLLLIDYNITPDTIEEFKTNRPLFEKYIKLKKELEETKKEQKRLLNNICELQVTIWMMKYSWSSPTSDIDIINSNYNSHYKLTAEQLLKMAQDLVTHPRKYIDIIVSLQKRYLELAEVNNNKKNNNIVLQ